MSWVHGEMDDRGVWLNSHNRRIPHGHGGVDGATPGQLTEDGEWEVLPQVNADVIILKNVKDSRVLQYERVFAAGRGQEFSVEGAGISASFASDYMDGFSQYAQHKMKNGKKHPFYSHKYGQTHDQWWER